MVQVLQTHVLHQADPLIKVMFLDNYLKHMVFSRVRSEFYLTCLDFPKHRNYSTGDCRTHGSDQTQNSASQLTQSSHQTPFRGCKRISLGPDSPSTRDGELTFM
ncbi:uncharacterized protein LOC108200044 [Daucus carota subsp. sativus]|uniref:uncharacterized protein LOC108200044 n=1 Tax=Daucus carota subsp. sativus TaxID=79200 RepID=UPI0030831CB7